MLTRNPLQAGLRRCVAPVLLAAGVLLAGAASATSIPNQVLTLDAPVNFSITGAAGTIDPFDLAATDYANDVTCLVANVVGACDSNDYSNQDWGIFQVNVTSGSLDEFAAAALFESPLALGYFDLLGGTNPTGSSSFLGSTAEFDFGAPLLTGQSAVLYVSYAAGDLPSSGFGEPLNVPVGGWQFDPRLGGASSDFQGIMTTEVPEPSTALLLGLGLVALARGRR